EVLEKLFTSDLDYSPANIVNLGWSKACIDALQMLPNPYHQYYFQTKEVLEQDIEAYENTGTRSEVVRKLEESLFDIYKDPELRDKPKALERRGGTFYSDVAYNLIDSI